MQCQAYAMEIAHAHCGYHHPWHMLFGDHMLCRFTITSCYGYSLTDGYIGTFEYVPIESTYLKHGFRILFENAFRNTTREEENFECSLYFS